MKGQKLKIIFNSDKAYLTEDKSLSFDQVKLPATTKYFDTPAYWVIEVINYIPHEKRLFCKVLSYISGETDFEVHQKLLANELNLVQFVGFKDINTSALLRTSRGNSNVNISHPEHEVLFRNEVLIRNTPSKLILAEQFTVAIKNLNFKNDCVSFEAKSKTTNRKLEIIVHNEHIREEYDAVKNYFANLLGKKKIVVDVDIHTTGSEVTSIDANSPEIDQIDERFIEQVRLDFARHIKTKTFEEKAQVVLVMNEMFDIITDHTVDAKVFYKDEKELFEDLLKISDSKHYNYLRFLSNMHLHNIMKLRFVHNPISFIFLLEGKNNYHIVWETLDTEEATYVWHFDKEIAAIKSNIQLLNRAIKEIKLNGKNAYIKSTADSFNRIFHDYSDISSGFQTWKVDLEGILNR